MVFPLIETKLEALRFRAGIVFKHWVANLIISVWQVIGFDRIIALLLLNAYSSEPCNSEDCGRRPVSSRVLALASAFASAVASDVLVFAVAFDIAAAFALADVLAPAFADDVVEQIVADTKQINEFSVYKRRAVIVCECCGYEPGRLHQVRRFVKGLNLPYSRWHVARHGNRKRTSSESRTNQLQATMHNWLGRRKTLEQFKDAFGARRQTLINSWPLSPHRISLIIINRKSPQLVQNSSSPPTVEDVYT